MVGKIAKAKWLELMLRGEDKTEAPVKTKRYGTHYQFLVGIGNDHTAFITMDDDAYNTLMAGEYLAIESD